MIFEFVIIVIINSANSTKTNFETETFLLGFFTQLLDQEGILGRHLKSKNRTVINYFNHDFTFLEFSYRSISLTNSKTELTCL